MNSNGATRKRRIRHPTFDEWSRWPSVELGEFGGSPCMMRVVASGRGISARRGHIFGSHNHSPGISHRRSPTRRRMLSRGWKRTSRPPGGERRREERPRQSLDRENRGISRSYCRTCFATARAQRRYQASPGRCGSEAEKLAVPSHRGSLVVLVDSKRLQKSREVRGLVGRILHRSTVCRNRARWFVSEREESGGNGGFECLELAGVCAKRKSLTREVGSHR